MGCNLAIYVGLLLFTRRAAADTAAQLTAGLNVMVATIDPAEKVTVILAAGMMGVPSAHVRLM